METHPTSLLTHLDSLPPLLEKILEKHIKELIEKGAAASGSKELLKAVVRLVLRLNRQEEAKESRRWGEFSGKVRKSDSLGEIVRGIESEHLDVA
ncbi:hypothetical protein EON65_35935 [archaeon]|nr:MAG: hypothetical protein EON65_35935 [archaeon]